MTVGESLFFQIDPSHLLLVALLPSINHVMSWSQVKERGAILEIKCLNTLTLSTQLKTIVQLLSERGISWKIAKKGEQADIICPLILNQSFLNLTATFFLMHKPLPGG